MQDVTSCFLGQTVKIQTGFSSLFENVLAPSMLQKCCQLLLFTFVYLPLNLCAHVYCILIPQNSQLGSSH